MDDIRCLLNEYIRLNGFDRSPSKSAFAYSSPRPRLTLGQHLEVGKDLPIKSHIFRLQRRNIGVKPLKGNDLG